MNGIAVKRKNEKKRFINTMGGGTVAKITADEQKASLFPGMKIKKSKSQMSNRALHFMLLPAIILVILYYYIPLLGITIAFQKFEPVLGLFGKQKWCGLDNFLFFFNMPDFKSLLFNTLNIAIWKIIMGLVIPLFFALLLNEIKNKFIKRSVQTLIYLPHFLSWVILSGVLITILSPNAGIVNEILGYFGVRPIFFLGDNKWFPFTIITTNIWKEFGWGTIIYLAALTGIDLSLYEAAYIDGASRWKQVWHVTLPGISGIVVLLMVLSLGQVLNAGFDQIFNLYSPMVYSSGDIIDTAVYRIGLVNGEFGLSTAIGLFKSVISLFLISTSYYFAYKFADYRIF